jgi:electron-transferring-flavoprotein dehydrogenase
MPCLCSEVVRWLAQRAEELGVEIYPGFAAAEALYARRGGPAGTVVGIATGDMGIGAHTGPVWVLLG